VLDLIYSYRCPIISLAVARNRECFDTTLIGTLRRDCLDHVLIFGERHLRRVLTSYSVRVAQPALAEFLGGQEDCPPARVRRATAGACGRLLARADWEQHAPVRLGAIGRLAPPPKPT
jgi:hypothetical protein